MSCPSPSLMDDIAALAPEPEELSEEEYAKRLAALRQGRMSIVVRVKAVAKPKRGKKVKEMTT